MDFPGRSRGGSGRASRGSLTSGIKLRLTSGGEMSESRFAEAMVSFDVFQIDLQAGELRREGRRIKIQEQPFRVLFLLLERAGEVVTREELRETLWPADTFVDFDHGLNSAVARLREALRDSAEKPRFIETIAKRGYRFIAPLVTAQPSVATTNSSCAEGETLIGTRGSGKILIFGSIGLVLFAV